MALSDPMISVPTTSTFEEDDDDEEENGQMSEMKIPIVLNCTNHDNIQNHVRAHLNIKDNWIHTL
jgi:hypothetical protein